MTNSGHTKEVTLGTKNSTVVSEDNDDFTTLLVGLRIHVAKSHLMHSVDEFERVLCVEKAVVCT